MPMTDDDLEQFVLSLQAEIRALNIRVGTLRLLVEQLGVTDAQYDAALAQATAAAQVSPKDGTKH